MENEYLNERTIRPSPPSKPLSTRACSSRLDSSIKPLENQEKVRSLINSEGKASKAMHGNQNSQPGMQRPPLSPQQTTFSNPFYGAGSGLIRGGLEAYGEKFLGSSSEFMQSNISRYFSNPQYYFQVNNKYVRSKVKLILLPFLHRGHWGRMSEPVGGRLSYKPPIYDINAPDLYVPFMAFVTYIILSGFTFGLLGKFSPEALSLQFTRGLAGWLLQVMMLKGLLYSLGSGEAPFLDIVAYGGYAFTGLSVAILTRLVWNHSYYFILSWL
ncbi:hypothetical protein J5N97_027374 [Dioscorea zingiberensis]|uniref:Uncharacterized protein n=1 Tax=Dioscorea zingiberensis TaxID=325984 RepID=A0A9D5C3W5_9LILI|nr:hypothetical protein J5N97_027374 [Dioscorea zingiberensis]